MRSSTKKTLIAVLTLCLGLGMLLYPYVSNVINQRHQSQVASNQEQTIASSGEGDLTAEKEKAFAYNAALLNGRAVVTDPFDQAALRPNAEDYTNALNIAGDGVMATLHVPSIGVALPIYHGTSDEVLQKGVGHLERTSLPIGGESSHSVLSGHTGLPTMQVFDKIDRLKEGDWFIIRVLGEDHAYKVTSVETVLPEQTESLTIVPGKDVVTLVTCTPYGVNSHRLLVHAERIDVPAEWEDAQKSEYAPIGFRLEENSLIPFTFIGIAIAVGVVLGIWLRRSRETEEKTLKALQEKLANRWRGPHE
ncbi:class C sortase [Atopobium fossor]|uniref:class C sortase n=1 Tax=Atopobium fossor TaxID=39487 RepID=UPI000420246B|nr:class C sortase [Atopobium fossor]